MTKKRPPINQLRKAGKLAKDMLVARGLETKDSTIDQILADKDSPTLPGIPAYLPRSWTIKASQRILADLVVEWMHAKESIKNENDMGEFMKFAVNRLHEQEMVYSKEMDTTPELIKSMGTVPVLKDVFSPLRKKQAIKGIHRFIVDSFAVSVIVKQHDSVSSFLDWFAEWTNKLDTLWIHPSKR